MTLRGARIDLSRAVRHMGVSGDVVLELYDTPGMWINGRWEAPEGATATIIASVQPAGEDVERLPEGLRTKNAISVFSVSELRPVRRAENEPSDVVRWDGERYEVGFVEDWNINGKYWRAVCTKVDQ